jgi:large repetitive protein
MVFFSRPAKNISVLLCLFVLFQAILPKAHAQMRQVYNSIPNNDIKKISFYSAKDGFVAFSNFIGYTTDSGRTFTQRPITMGNVNYNGYSVNLTFGFGINGVKAFDQNNIVVYGDYGLVPSILHSNNGGISYTLIYHSQYNPFQLSTGITDMVFPQNNATGFAVDADRILKTTNQGLNWSVVAFYPGSFFDYMEAVDNNNVFALSTQYNTNKLLKTTNGGTNWTNVSLPVLPNGKMNYAHFLTAGTGWLSMQDDNNDYSFYKTTTGGSSWVRQNDLEATPFRCGKMKFTDANTGYALVMQNMVWKTLNSGVTWEPLPRDNNYSYLGYTHEDLHFFSPTQLWAGGGHGFLELSTNSGGTPDPKAYFKIDTVGLFATGNVNLLNFSRTSYTYKWFLNDVQISTAYNTSYLHDLNRLKDTIKLVVSNGTSTDTLIRYQYFHPPVRITSFTPTSAGTGNVINITGSNFLGAGMVTFGGVPASSFNVVSATSINATVGGGASGHVRVVTGTGQDSLAGFTYIPAPTIASFTPTSAAAGTTVTITGTNFVAVSAVRFAGINATSFIVVSPTTIDAVVPSGTSGAVSVTTPGGTATLAGFISLPTVTSFTPLQGTQGTIMTITGTSFTGTTAVTVGAVNVLSFVVNSSTSITAIIGTGATGDVTVTKPGGSSSKPTFTWFANPVITSFSPASGPVGTTVTITGTGFNATPSNNIVYFGAVKASVTAGTTTSLTVTVPTNATFEPISVMANNLIGYSNMPFLVTFSNGGSITANSFANRTIVTEGPNTYPQNISLGDIDGDGKTDLIVTKYSTPSTAANLGFMIYRNTSTISSVSFAAPFTMGNLDYVETITGDLDGDGKLDLAVIKNQSIATFINTSTPGNISFTAGAVLSAANSPDGIAIGDVDGDGKADIVANHYPDLITSVFRNISEPGAISFAPRVNFPVRGGRNILITDIDGDRKPELVIPNAVDYEMVILKNNCTKGNISFGTAIAFPGYTHSYMASGDIDGDGRTDLITGDHNGSKVAVLLNTSTAGNISMAPPVELHATSWPGGVAVSDLDGDGKLDIAAGLYNASVAVFKNTSTVGSVSFASRIDYITTASNGNNFVTLGDIDGDGKNDAIASSHADHAISVHLNNVKPEPFILSFNPVQGGAGTVVTITGNNFTGVTAVSFGGVAASSFVVNSPTSITATVGTGASGNVSVTNNIGTGVRAAFAFGTPPVITSIAPAFAAVGASVTITGTNFSPVGANNTVFFGGVKAVVTSATTNSIIATVPTGTGYEPIKVTVDNLTAYSQQIFSVTFPGAGAAFSSASFAPRIDRTAGLMGAVSDLDADGKLDLVRSATGGLGLAIAKNTSTPGVISFLADTHFATPFFANGLTADDLDGDGKPDVAFYNASASTFTTFRNTTSTGIISFAPGATHLTGAYAQADPNDIFIKDLDGDGKPDVMISNYGTNTVGVFRNISSPGNILFDNRIDYGISGGYPTSVTAIDMNGDGKPELMTSVNGNGNFMAVFKNTSVPGVISFDLKVSYSTGQWPSGIEASDIDGDSKLDIVVNNLNSNTISVYRNLSTTNISFAPKQDFSTGNGPRSFTICDFDGDGKPDIAEQNYYSDKTTSVIKNTSSPGSISMLPKFDYTLVQSAYRSTSGDMDGDGSPDLLTFDLLSGTTAIFRNTTGTAVVVQLCANGNTSITSNLTGTSYQWQQNTGAGFVNISDNINFTGTNTVTLAINNIPIGWNNYQYRCVVNSNFSVITIINLNAVPVASAGGDVTICLGSSTQLNGSGGTTYLWSPATGLSNPNIANPVASPIVTTSYILTVYSNTACFAKDTVVVTVTQPATPNVTISTPSNNVCAGSTVNFTAVSTNGGSSPAYQWQVNGSNAGSNSSTFSSNTLANNDQVRVILTSNASCITGNMDTSNVIIMNVGIAAAPTAAITASATAVCSGSLVTFNATVTNEGTNPTYQWQVNGINAGTNNNFFNTFTLNNNDQVKLILTSSLACATPASVTSNIISISVTPAPFADAGNDTTICAGTSAQLHAQGGTTYSWSPATGLSNPNIANPVATPLVTTRYYLTVFNGSCFANDSVLVTVNQATSASVNISASTNNICSGTSVIFTATASGGGSNPVYQWQVNGINAGTNSNTFTTTALNNNDQVTVILTSSLTCVTPQTVSSNTIVMNVTPAPVAQAGNDNTICAGASVQLQGSGGSIYSWSPAAGLSNPNIANPVATPASTTAYILTVSNGGTCTAKDTVVITVNQPVTPTANISATGLNICAGTSVTFTAAITNGGTSPVYQWQINGINAGNNSNSFTSNTLQNNDQVKLILTSNHACVSATTATSNTITMIVQQLDTPIISLGNQVFTVTNPDAGAGYNWQVLLNAIWTNIPAATGISFTSPGPGEYRVRAVKGSCTKYSASLVAGIISPTSHVIYLRPNPAHNVIRIDSIRLQKRYETVEITDMQGKRVLPLIDVRNRVTVSINISSLTNGSYMMIIRQRDGTFSAKKFIKQ